MPQIRMPVNRGGGAPSLSGIRRRNSGFLYSSRLLPATLSAGNYDYFITAVGNIGQGYAGALTFTETNLTNAQRVPDQTGYIIDAIGFYWTQETEAGTSNGASPIADLDHVLNFSYLSFRKTEYEYILGPTALFPAGCGIYGISADTTAVTEYVTSGVPSPQARKRLDTPIVLQPGETFSFRQVVTTAVTMSAATKAWIILEGDSFSKVMA